MRQCPPNWSLMAIRIEYGGKGDENEGNTIDSSVTSNRDRVERDKYNVEVKFIADLGATEHLSKIELIKKKKD